jgi:hypothetical protein
MQANEQSQENGVNGPETELTVERPSPEELWLEVNRLRVRTQYQTEQIMAYETRSADLEASRLKIQCFLADQGLLREFETFHEDERRPDWQKLWADKYALMTDERSSYNFHGKLIDEKTVELFNISRGMLERYGVSEIIGALSDLADNYQNKYYEELGEGEVRDFEQSEDIQSRSQVALWVIKYVAAVYKNVDYISNVRRMAKSDGSFLAKFENLKTAPQS